MTTTTDTCWADPLTRKERAELAARLARACHRFYNIPAGTAGAMYSQIIASAEMSDLHLDVTERAALPPEVADRQKADADAIIARRDPVPVVRPALGGLTL